MKEIVTTTSKNTILEQLEIELNPSSTYGLIENGLVGIDNCINVYFDPKDLNDAKQRLREAGYYKLNAVSHLIGKQDGDAHIIPLSDIIYIEGINNDTYLHTVNGVYSSKEKLYQLEEKLSRLKFIRISKSYIVSMYRIEKIKTTFQGKLLLILNQQTKLEVSRHYVKAFKQVLGM